MVKEAIVFKICAHLHKANFDAMNGSVLLFKRQKPNDMKVLPEKWHFSFPIVRLKCLNEKGATLLLKLSKSSPDSSTFFGNKIPSRMKIHRNSRNYSSKVIIMYGVDDY